MPTYTSGSQDTLAPEGDYFFKVVDSGEKVSQQQNEMIELTLECWNGSGEKWRVYDQLVFTPKAFWKIDQFRLSTGEVIVAGKPFTLEAEDCIDRQGILHLIIDSTGRRPKNKVSEYLSPPVPKTAPAAATAAVVVAVADKDAEPDDIPF
jgi:hypothetical protein